MITDLSLFIAGVEWIIILFFALILLLGTNRLPNFARSIGRAVGEFQKARNYMDREIQRVNKPITISIKGPVASEREKLEAIAKALGINIEGKSDDELRQLISDQINPDAGKDR